MKKQLLLSSLLTLSNLSIALEIPSFEHIRETSSHRCSKSDATFLAFKNYLLHNHEMPLENIEPIIISWFKDNPELYDYANGLHEQEPAPWQEEHTDNWAPVEPAILKVHQDLNEYHASGAYLEDQKFFKVQRDLEIQLHRYLGRINYVDNFLVMMRTIIKYFPELLPLVEAKEQQKLLADAARCNGIIHVLQKLGIQQTISDERIDLLADLAIAHIRFLDTENDKLTFRQMQQGSTQEEIVILKKLIATYES